MVGIYLGDQEIQDLAFGATAVTDVYVGAQKVWPATATPPYMDVITGWFDFSNQGSLTIGTGSEIEAVDNLIDPSGEGLVKNTDLGGPTFAAAAAELGGMDGARFENAPNFGTNSLFYASQSLPATHNFAVIYCPLTHTYGASQSIITVVVEPATGLNRGANPTIANPGLWKGFGSSVMVNGEQSQNTIPPQPSGLVAVDTALASRYLQAIGLAGAANSVPPVTSGGNAGFNGWIGEVLTYPREMNTTEAGEIRQYLYDKWGIVPTIEEGES